MAATRILLVEDHALVREGVRMLLAREPDLQVVGETGDGARVLELIAALQPHMLVLDLELSGCDGVALAQRVAVLHPQCRVLVLTASAQADTARRALAAGVAGYVVKQEGSAVLIDAVRAVRGGQRFVCIRMAGVLAAGVAAMAGAVRPTERERELMGLIAQGYNNLGIANTLHLSLHTVRTHRQNLMAKLCLRNAAEITAYAIKAGYVGGTEAQAQAA